jgi:hypothetical protein
METSTLIVPLPRRRWPGILLGLGIAWGQIVLVLGTLSEPTPENQTLCFAIEAAGLYTLLLYATRRIWLPALSSRPLLSAAALGVFNAALIEAEFWAFERLFGASGVAASPNLLVDWLVTMPWYIGMVVLFVRGQRRSRFGAVTLLLLAGLYELAADGVIGGQLVPLAMGEPVDLLAAWGFLILIAFWEFVLVYSSMLLPPAWILEAGRAAAPAGEVEAGRAGPRWRDALLPLAWAAPYSAYLAAVLVAIFVLSGG